MISLKRTAYLMSSVASVAITLPAAAQTYVPTNPFYKNTPYVAGDLHNHNVCNDGSTSAPFTLNKSLSTFGIDWFTLGNHGGSGNRDCRLATDPADPTVGASNGAHTNDTWSTTLGTTVSGITISQLKGTPNGNNMWAWQRVSEIEYPILQQKGQQFKKLTIEGLESIVPGHEHADVTVLTGQFVPVAGTLSADPLAKFEFLYDRADGDQIGKLDASNNPLWTGKSSNNSGTLGHAKAVASVAYLQATAPLTSYYVPTHSERAGVFNPAGNDGWNIESFRDLNNAGPTVAVGIEAPGHAADPTHSYRTTSVGPFTFGGDGVYTAKLGGLWDGLLGEGRNSFIFISSDWHNRGIFASNDRFTTGDFYPGEYSKLYVPNQKKLQGTSVVDGMRSGNSYSVTGNLIGPDLLFRVCDSVNNVCKGMGETLVVNPGDKLTVEMSFTVPGTNISPYSFNNPMLLQNNKSIPINAPVLDHVDLITGDVTGVIAPTDPKYNAAYYAAGGVVTPARVTASVYNPSTKVAKRFTPADWTVSGKRVTITYPMTAPSTAMYVRTRGTNIMVGTPHVMNSDGEFTIDSDIANVPCTDPACPAHLPKLGDTAKAPNGAGAKGVGLDVEAWSSLRFQTNPVFIRPASSAPLLVEVNAQKAQTIAAQASSN